MGLPRVRLERQLEHARTALAARNETLDSRGVSPEDRQRDPKWRAFKAECLHLEGRLRAADSVTAREEDRARRKQEQPSE